MSAVNQLKQTSKVFRRVRVRDKRVGSAGVSIAKPSFILPRISCPVEREYN